MTWVAEISGASDDEAHERSIIERVKAAVSSLGGEVATFYGSHVRGQVHPNDETSPVVTDAAAVNVQVAETTDQGGLTDAASIAADPNPSAPQTTP